MTECIHRARTSAYFDGALPEAEQAGALFHVETCAQCQELLRNAATFDAVISSAPATVRAAPGARRRRWLIAAASGVAAAAVIALWFVLPRSTPPGPPVALVLPADRAIEARFTAPRFAPHRPFGALRGDHLREVLPLTALAALETAGQLPDLVAALAATGDLARARDVAAQLPDDAAGEADRAAVALASGMPEEALGHAYRAVDHAPELAAGWWNLALAARELHLVRVAHAAFEKVISRAEPGWADEARDKLGALEREVGDQGPDFVAFEQRARAMVVGGDPIALADARRFATYARVYLLEAIRLRSGPALDALRPIARELDGLAGTPGLSDAIDRAAAAPAALRIRFAARYRAVFESSATPAQIAGLIDALRVAGPAVDDLRVGTIILAHQTTARVAELRAITAGWHDPWFDLLVVLETIRATSPAGDPHAEPALEVAVRGCNGDAWALRCGLIAWELSDRLVQQGRDHDAEPWARLAVDRYRVAIAPAFLRYARLPLAEIHRHLDRASLARAELEEIVLAGPDCDVHVAQVRLAYLAFAGGELGSARRTLPPPRAEPGCPTGPDALGLSVAVDLARQSRDPGDLARAHPWIDAQGDAFDHGLAVVGRLRIATARDDAAIRAVRDWIAAHARNADPVIAGIRAWGTTTLISDAGARGDWADVFASSMAEHALDIAAPCALAATFDDGALTVAGRTGRTLAGEQRRVAQSRLGDIAVVSPALTAALEGCREIAVLARPPIHGRSLLLPRHLPWAFVGDAQPSPVPRPGSTVEVLEALPPDPGLTPLSVRRSTQPFDVSIQGAEATPSRVLDALRKASYVELHVHGVAAAASDDAMYAATGDAATYLALSPEGDGRFALRAGDVRAARLAGAPIVVLAACRAAAVGPYLRQRWSLPDAFLAAGASAVVAADIAIPDATARGVFDELHRRVAAGEPIEQAVAAVRATATGDTAWATHLVVFR